MPADALSSMGPRERASRTCAYSEAQAGPWGEGKLRKTWVRVQGLVSGGAQLN